MPGLLRLNFEKVKITNTVFRRYQFNEILPWHLLKTVLASWRNTFDKRTNFLHLLFEKVQKSNVSKKVSPDFYYGLLESLYYDAAGKFLTKKQNKLPSMFENHQTIFFLDFFQNRSLWRCRIHISKHYQKRALEASVLYAHCAILTEKCSSWRNFFPKTVPLSSRKLFWQLSRTLRQYAKNLPLSFRKSLKNYIFPGTFLPKTNLKTRKK